MTLHIYFLESEIELVNQQALINNCCPLLEKLNFTQISFDIGIIFKS